MANRMDLFHPVAQGVLVLPSLNEGQDTISRRKRI